MKTWRIGVVCLGQRIAHVLAAMQLTGSAGAMQLPRADLAGVFNMGGAAVANYVSILERG